MNEHRNSKLIGISFISSIGGAEFLGKILGSSSRVSKMARSCRYEAVNHALLSLPQKISKINEQGKLVAEIKRISKADPEKYAAVKKGDISWFSPRFGLNNLALEDAFGAIVKGDMQKASVISELIIRTGANGPKAMRLAALIAAHSGDWDKAEHSFSVAFKGEGVGPYQIVNNDLFADLQIFLRREAGAKFGERISSIKEENSSCYRIMKHGWVSWYNKIFGLNDIALATAYQALELKDYTTASMVADLIVRTDSKGARAMHLAAMVAAVNGEWKNGRRFYGIAASKSKKVASLSAARWEYEEQLFADLSTTLQDVGCDWVDLSPWRPRSERLLALEALIKSKIKSGELNPEMRLVLDGYTRLRSLGTSPRAVAAAATVRTMRLENFRNYLAGKKVCLVANSAMLLKHNLGEVIDAHDVVIRFNSFAIDPPKTGVKTNVHACIHLYNYNLEVPVDVRIMVSGSKTLWRDSVHEKIVPGAQKWLGDSSLSWPARDLKLILEKDATRTPTVGFNILRTIWDFAVCREINLIGFDFYRGGMLRISDATSIPHSAAHNSEAERAWVMANASSVSDAVISMLPTTDN